MTRTRRPRRTLALASVAGVGLLTTAVAIALVSLVVTDPAGTADALNAREAAPMIHALASLIWRALGAVIKYL